ncbi:FAD-dependent thymidylate synthase [Thermogymnomonas acidicola]|nr:FAD-dependent thymidylate synthase [Thermogymnomonas acidicola]
MGDPFSNTDRDVFLIKVERQIDRGALLSRYSRASALDIREVYRKEFENDPERGPDFYRRVFMEYGDESVSELVTVQMAVQNVSNVVSKFIEEQRIGLSYLEKSTRYVRYSVKRDGRYLYADPDRAGIQQSLSGDYEQACDLLFETYSDLEEPLYRLAGARYPLEEQVFQVGTETMNVDAMSEGERKAARRAYERALRARVLDDIRFLLPASTLTNVGISGNGRALTYLIQRLRSSALREARELASSIYGELKGELPNLIDAAVNRHGERLTKYISGISSMMEPVAPGAGEDVRLLSCPDEAAFGRHLFSAMKSAGLVPRGARDLPELAERISSMRMDRRDKLPRPFELARYDFTMNISFGAFRDVQRHRFLTLLRGYLNTDCGYVVPELIASDEQARLRFVEAMETAASVHRKIRDVQGPQVAQYCVPFAFRYPVFISTNLRELCFFMELRTSEQTHYEIRRALRELYRQVSERTPILASMMKFVDTREHGLGRLRAEMRKEANSGN